MKVDTVEKRIVDVERNFSVTFVEKYFPIATAGMDLMIGENGKEYWWLARVVVRKEHRMKGLGRKLLDELKKKAKGIKIVVCPGGYDITQKEQFTFYRKMGFVETEEGSMEWMEKA